MVLLISSCVLTLVVFYDDYLVRSDIIIVLLNLMFFLYCFFFFFQAEDGIRDVAVTGVQTCALPIWRQRGHHHRPDALGRPALRGDDARRPPPRRRVPRRALALQLPAAQDGS